MAQSKDGVVKKLSKCLLFVAMVAISVFACSHKERHGESSKRTGSRQTPQLRKQGDAVQLVVDGKPFLILGGELGNSSFTGLEYMEPIWAKLKAMNLNTVLAPVYWELIEPMEGEFDFQLYDRLIEKAGNHDLKLVLLWFGSWKNSMSSHAPAWVKKDRERFPRIRDDRGGSHEILTPFSENNLNADMNAFKALMGHIREIDGEKHAVLMVQCENEIGMLPAARDHHPLANGKYLADVPDEFTAYLKTNRENLTPEFREIWGRNGYRDSGSWEEIFGKGPQTEEIFMAWFYSKFTNALVKAGKEIYPLPMYVNAALNRPGSRPGEGYPSGGPLPHLMDVWKAGGPSIDFLSPDFYFPDIERWCDLYTRRGNPLFIPEHRFDGTVGAKALFVFGHYGAIGFAPFSIESARNPEDEPLGKIYRLMNQLTPLIAAGQGRHRMEGVFFDKETKERIFRLGNYEFTAKHSYTLGYEAGSRNEQWETTGAVVVQTGENEFILAGSGIVMTFKNAADPDLNVGILKDDEGRFENGGWKVIRHLNGDQTHQGRHVRILLEDGFSIQKFELYNFE